MEKTLMEEETREKAKTKMTHKKTKREKKAT